MVVVAVSLRLSCHEYVLIAEEMLHLPRWIAGNGHFHERLDLSANLCDEVGRQAG